eukprot:3867913-Pleurochrysis_carterae.AAC.1
MVLVSSAARGEVMQLLVCAKAGESQVSLDGGRNLQPHASTPSSDLQPHASTALSPHTRGKPLA